MTGSDLWTGFDFDRDRDFICGLARPYPKQAEEGTVRVVDLFCGCGGMSAGLREACLRTGLGFDVALAVDSDQVASNVFRDNFGRCATADVAKIFDVGDGSAADLVRPTTSAETQGLRDLGFLTRPPLHILMGGPPCQGHSNLNNRSRREDNRNDLYRIMARAAAILRPQVVLVENVSMVVHDKKRNVAATWAALELAGYSVDATVLDLKSLGVPQTRRRHVLVASRIPCLHPRNVLAQLLRVQCKPRTIAWAIADLETGSPTSFWDRASSPSPDNRRRMDFLHEHDLYRLPNSERPSCHRDKDHSYLAVYGRMSWDDPAHTITTGFDCMGQGCYVHPSKRRTITPHEAARLQTISDLHDFRSVTTRAQAKKLIGNAVPPLMTIRFGEAVLPWLEIDEQFNTDRANAHSGRMEIGP